ncbi:MAG: N-formylglutamate amidohydrolase [Qipengyuania sp.]
MEIVGRTDGDSPFVLLGDHAGNSIPGSLNDLGLPDAELTRHIAIDLGVAELGTLLAERLAAPFIRQTYSRLAIDCNRNPSTQGSIAETSDGTCVPGNQDLSPAQRAARAAEIFEPYHEAISRVLDDREARAQETILVSLHSFTPVFAGFARPWDIGVLHDGRRDSFALDLLARLQAAGEWSVADNEPYKMDETDYTVPRHAYPRSLRYVEVEVRQDLIHPASSGSFAPIAELLARSMEDCV